MNFGVGEKLCSTRQVMRLVHRETLAVSEQLLEGMGLNQAPDLSTEVCFTAGSVRMLEEMQFYASTF